MVREQGSGADRGACCDFGGRDLEGFPGRSHEMFQNDISVIRFSKYRVEICESEVEEARS